MKSAILSIGTELLFGQIVNTNAAYLSKELNNLGIDVMYHYTMGDNPGRLKRMLELALFDCDMLICTGGLGPTEDDLTKETICEYMNEELVLNEKALAEINSFFDRTGMQRTENNFKQAYVPEHATIFPNGAGTAPGFALEKDGKTIICMPGVPREMTYMFEHEVKSYLSEKVDAVILSKSVKVFGIGESAVETMLLDIIDNQTDPTIATYAKEGEVEVRITSKRKTAEEARKAVEEMVSEVSKIIGNNIYSTDGKELYEEVCEKILKENISISSCESPTAGLFASTLAQYPGISKVFDRGIVAYSSKSKSQEFNISPDTIEKFTPYSPEISQKMVQGLAEKTGSRLCIAITGLAGTENYKEIKAGSYFISVIYDGQEYTREFYHSGRTRQLNQRFMTLSMFYMINQIINGRDFTDISR